MIEPGRLKKCLGTLNSTGIPFFVSGGVGLDGLRGKLSREHGDLDIYMFESDLSQLFQKMKAAGYRCFRKLNKFEVQGDGITIDVLSLKDEGSTLYLKGNSADTRFPKKVFEKHLEGKIDGVTFPVVAGEVFALEMPLSKYPEDRQYAASIPYDKQFFLSIESVKKDVPSDIVLEEI